MATSESVRNSPHSSDTPGNVLDCTSGRDNDQYDPTLLLKSLAAARRQRIAVNPFEMIGVAFRNMSVYGCETSTDYLPTFGNYPHKILSMFSSSHRRRVPILNGFDGLVNKGEMLLVLGRPGSGCSTLLKTIAGVKHGLHITDESDLRYDGNVVKREAVEGYSSNRSIRSLITQQARSSSWGMHLQFGIRHTFPGTNGSSDADLRCEGQRISYFIDRES